ncbi:MULTISPECIES: putative lipid II flippase FtsW [Brevibacterium]|uniref:Probable peptidoglycan glycosyltransferase FtsW n=1 Tax=Brevibacterium luteolum TaxID=199591 RepID=A0A2N6PL97_9MICO|nr:MULTISPECIES: putative lipid II flippase FtsW [Brevibacterium]MCT1829887.1 putative lipid II flippase FtsW [Brevibacterium luteolum]MCT1872731.1 putative lipid II flippase FtsW [Brevibacterium luteolum]MCT1890245.1 putative lipid II flippase FtsW [Brevibacterium luteolum]MCT1891941.1 putative lipid II flippase FtsW [Brevibacterium luteolum]MCT1923482.1 putative lipid II flippase FtsW [Brevibacterium luteolum]
MASLRHDAETRRTRAADFTRGTGVMASLRRLLDLPVTSYYLVFICVLALIGFGLIMVLSASSITAYRAGEGSSFSVFNRQGIYAIIGVTVMIALSYAPVNWFRKAAPIIFIGALALQTLPLIPGLGHEVQGNAGWIRIGGFQGQPAEFTKVALAIWLATFFAHKATKLTSLKEVMPAIIGLAAVLGLVLAGRDLGTALIVMATALGTVFVAGLPWRYLITAFLGIAAVVTLLVITSANRMARIRAMFVGHENEAMDPLGQHWQSNHGLFALASGGWFGVGLGASREKWLWLPEAHNDFIFAIIGEELGLLGSVAVLLLFSVLGYGLIRIVLRTDDRMIQAATAGIFMWLIGQALVNIGVVSGVLPVIGVPLPFVSYGGSALLATCIAAGVVLAFARAESGAQEAMRAQNARVRESLAVLASSPLRLRKKKRT